MTPCQQFLVDVSLTVLELIGAWTVATWCGNAVQRRLDRRQRVT